MVDQESLQLVRGGMIEQHLGHPFDGRNLRVVLIQRGSFIAQDQQGISGNAVQRFDPAASQNGNPGKAIQVEGLEIWFGGGWKEIENGRGVAPKGKKYETESAQQKKVAKQLKEG